MSEVLAGKTVVITGASRGVGLASAIEAGAQGARVVLLARSDASEAAEKIGNGSFAISCDVGDGPAVRNAFAQIREGAGAVYALVNNAGIGRTQAVDKLTDEDIAAHVGVNFLGTVHTVREAVPMMREAGTGHIINISSETVSDPFPFLALYAGTKAGTETFTGALRREVKASGIRVTLLRIGATMTDFASGWDPEVAGAAITLWQKEGYLKAGLAMEPQQVAHHVCALIAAPPGALMESIELQPG